MITLAVSATVFDILTPKPRKWQIFTIQPFFEASLREPLEFLDETCPTKTTLMELPYGKNFIS